jgi:hypothetical protein
MNNPLPHPLQFCCKYNLTTSIKREGWQNSLNQTNLLTIRYFSRSHTLRIKEIYIFGSCAIPIARFPFSVIE